MKDVAFYDKEVSDIQENKLNFSYLVFDGGISVSLFSIENNKYHNFIFKTRQEKSHIQLLNEINKQENFNKKKFNKIIVQFASNQTTIIPESFFNEESYTDLFHFNFLEDKNKNIKFYHLNKEKLYVLFDINKELLSYFDNNFNNYVLIPHAATFIQTNLKKAIVHEDEFSDKIFIQIFNDFFDIMYVKDKALKFYNTFSYNSSNDILYYILNVFEQLKINQEKTEVILSGLIKKDSATVLNLKKFIKFVNFETLSKDFKYYYKFQDNPEHYFSNFFNVNK